MHPNFEDYWPWYVTAWALYALGGILLVWALFWDRARRRGVTRYRCPKCWYDLRGIKDTINENTCCSECGRSIRKLRDLLHTRRTKRWSVVALVILLFGYYCFKKPISHDNWISYFPTSLLICLPLPEGSELDNIIFLESFYVESPLWASLSSRLRGGELWNWQERLLKSRVVRRYTRSNRMGISDLERQTARRVISSTIEIEDKPYTIRQLVEQIKQDVGIEIQADLENLAGSGFFGGQQSFNPPPATYLLNDLLDEFYLAQHWHPHTFWWRIENELIHFVDDIEYIASHRVVRYGIENYTTDYLHDSALSFILSHVTPDAWYSLGGDISSYIFLDNELFILTSVHNHYFIEKQLKFWTDPPGWFLPDSTIELLEKTQPSTIVQRTLSIRNLADSEAKVATIMVMIEETIDPSNWGKGGDYTHIDILPDKLFIKTTITNHRAIEQLLDDLRAKIEAGLSLEQAIDDLEKEAAGKPGG